MATRKQGQTRRSFLAAQTAGLAAVSLPAVVRARNLNERVRIGLIGTGNRGQGHLAHLLKLHRETRKIEPVAVCDVYNVHRQLAAERIEKALGIQAQQYEDYRELLQQESIDAVCIATPDHWHGRQLLDALAAGKHVYCEKPMTRTLEEAVQVLDAWRQSDLVVQVGVQRTSDGRWKLANSVLRQGLIGKVIQAQTGYWRNSRCGQWRYWKLTKEMTPKNINWELFLGTQFGLAPKLPFDRALFRQWQCYWPFSLGIFSDLFVHRVTEFLLALGVRFPRRVAAGGGIFLEYDGRHVPDTATLIADFDAGVQLVVTGTVVNSYPGPHLIRGYLGVLKFDLTADGFDFEPERPQIVQDFSVEPKHFEAPTPEDETYAHWRNFLDAVLQGDKKLCNNDPELGAAAVAVVWMGAESYRKGQVLEWDTAQNTAKPASADYARQWEELSDQGGPPRHIPGWNPKNTAADFSRPKLPEYQQLAGPWPDENTDPAQKR